MAHPILHDALVIGAGQAGLAAGYHLQHAGLTFVILESQEQPGGSWTSYYQSLKLFSPRRYSGLPGLPFPGDANGYPARSEVVAYLRHYASQFALPIECGVEVRAAQRAPDHAFVIHGTQQQVWRARNIIVATGSFRHPILPHLQGQESFRGRICHSMDYRNPDPFRDRRVLVVGAGNSAVQIAVELAGCARVTLATRRPVRFMPQRVLGRDIHFWLGVTGLDRCRWWSDQAAPVMDCGNYRAALAAGRPEQRPMFRSFTREGVTWPDGTNEPVEDVIFATGYREEFPFLKELPGALPQQRGASRVPGLYFVGLSGQTGLASATLRGVGRDAAEVVRALRHRG